MKDTIKSFFIALDDRLGYKETIHRHITGKLVPAHYNYLHNLGGLALLTIMIQLVSGGLMMLYYIPTQQQAFSSVQTIIHDIPFGWFIQKLHMIGTSALILLLLLHMMRVYWHQAFNEKRELHWLSGIFLLSLVLGMAFTGHLLPWNQLSYWGTTIGLEAIASLPLMGQALVDLLRGTDQISGMTLRRFYTIHTVVLPLLILMMLALHYKLIHRTGLAQKGSSQKGTGKKEIKFFPHLFKKKIILGIVFTALLLFLALSLPHSTHNPADPLTTPENIKPAWYFLAAYQLFTLMPGNWTGATLLILFIVLLMAVPFIDKRKKTSGKQSLSLAIAAAIVIVFMVLTWWGTL